MLYLHKLRYLLLLLIVAACVALWPGVKAAMVVDNSLSTWFLSGDPALREYHAFQQRFGNDEVVILAVHDVQPVLSPKYLAAFWHLTRELEALPAVAGVNGPGNTQLPGRGLAGSSRQLLMPGTTAAEVRQTLHPLPTLRQSLFSDDYRTARFIIRLRQMPDFDDRRGEILAQVQRVVDRHFRPEQAHLGGVGIVYAGLNALSQHDFGLFLGLGYLLMFGVLLLIYRNLLLLVYMLGIVGLATYVTFGVYGALGYRVNLMTVLLPIVLILLGIMDSMHVINERNRLRTPTSPARHDALQALRNVFAPCLFTMLTTVAGFLALLSCPMAILRNFGMFAALGIALCLVFTFLLGVLLLPLAKAPARTAAATHSAASRMVAFYQYLLARPRFFATLSVLLTLALAAGLPRLRSDTYTLGYLPATHRVVTDHEAIEASWGPYMPLELLVEPRPGHTLSDVAVVQATFTFADSVRRLSGVGQVTGFHSLYQAGLEAQVGRKATRLRASQGALHAVERQLGLEFPALLAQFVHAPSGTGRVTVSGRMLSARQLTAKVDTLLQIAQATLGPVATVRPAGYQPLYANIVAYVTESQTNSLLLSFGLVFALTWAFIRSFRLALLTVVPNLFPVLVLLGAMGWLGIPLDTATASIASIVLSLCVDDTIHFVYSYQQHRRHGFTPAQARLTTIAHVGPTIVLTSVVLFLGYAVMTLGSLKTVQLFGLLTAIAVAGAFYGELVIFPLVLKKYDPE
ncbi:efflux RND transporter permease subunit [Hymenobacter yonginensis]|uniref:MMPL family transporter n=1 Tax=Hymenobacter yonginensis TaxID=748197 RepID=A0ABY7PMP0_9BACT|nr:MMPL family transporter [Hymenobacter yonginensis]WBO83295.1 MMPL family transporter [Hymenobacter yonginensis]